jgi:hypothetical protein
MATNAVCGVRIAIVIDAIVANLNSCWIDICVGVVTVRSEQALRSVTIVVVVDAVFIAAPINPNVGIALKRSRIASVFVCPFAKGRP